MSRQTVGLVTEEMVAEQERSLFQGDLSSLKPAATALMRMYCQRGEFKKALAFANEYFGSDLEADTEFVDAAFPVLMAKKGMDGRQEFVFYDPPTEQTVLFEIVNRLREALGENPCDRKERCGTTLARARDVLSWFYCYFIHFSHLSHPDYEEILEALGFSYA